MALHELLDQFVADIGLIGNLPLSESEKTRLYIAAYEEFHVERKQLRASIK
jgi:hypothetical protein